MKWSNEMRCCAKDEFSQTAHAHSCASGLLRALGPRCVGSACRYIYRSWNKLIFSRSLKRDDLVATRTKGENQTPTDDIKMQVRQFRNVTVVLQLECSRWLCSVLPAVNKCNSLYTSWFSLAPAIRPTSTSDVKLKLKKAVSNKKKLLQTAPHL